MIDSYRFGRMTVNGKSYDRDLLILPDRVISDWRREEGHHLVWEDIKSDVSQSAPTDVVIGTGRSGKMKVDSSVSDHLTSLGAGYTAEPTEKAVDRFNRLVSEGRKVLGAFHLTC
jgi:hypothetical protein